MSLNPLLALLAFATLVAIPGLVWHRAWLSEGKFGLLSSIALVCAALVVLFCGFGSIMGYSLPLMLALNVGLLLAGMATGYRRGVTWRGWKEPLRMSRADAFGLALVIAIFAAPVLVLVVPLDTDAQGFGYLALTVREGGTLDSLAPFYPDVRYLYSPAYFVLTAYLSDLLVMPLHQVMLGLAHGLAALVALLAYDVGRALDRPRLGKLMVATTTLGTGLLTTLMDSGYTTVLALLFVELVLIGLWRTLDDPRPRNIALAGLALAAVPLSHPDTTLILLMAYVPFYATAWLSKDMTRQRFWYMCIVIPVLGVILTLPWVVRVLSLFFEEHIESPFLLSLSHWRSIVLFNGLFVPVLAGWGLVLAARRRRLADVWMVTWVVLVVDFAMFGLSAKPGQLIGVDIMRYMYPASVAWHGPIVPFAYLAARALDDLCERLPRIAAWNWPRLQTGASIAGLMVIGLLVVFNQPLTRLSKNTVSIWGAFSSQSDVDAYLWLKDNSPPDSLLFNYPLHVEGHWAAVISERDSVAFRDQHFFNQRIPFLIEQTTPDKSEPNLIYHNLASPETEAWIRQHGIDYVFVPQLVNDPDALRNIQRWQPPRQFPFESLPEEADYLKLVYEQDGARIYQVLEDN